MIKKIRNSYLTKGVSLSMIVVMFFTMIAPINSYALTGGPAQPEFNAFTPIGTSDMVDLASGDFSYNIPLMDIGGFPINLAYSSGVTMDQEASWVGLGWNLSIGQINRQMRGLPDDFKGDLMEYKNDMKDNLTVGGTIKVNPYIAGNKVGTSNNSSTPGNISFGLSMQYNNHTGYSLRPSFGVTTDQRNAVSIGLNIESGPDGMSLSPNVSFNGLRESKLDLMEKLGSKIGATFNSRQGLVNVNMSASHSGHGSDWRTRMKKGANIGGQSIGSNISYIPNHHTPQIQDNLLTENGTFNASLGSEFFGGEFQSDINAFYSKQYIPNQWNTRSEPAYGYDNNHLAGTDEVKDFNREKDVGISSNSTNLPITNFTYDIYSVQGQGVGGMFRPYRSQIGYVNDKHSQTVSGGESLGVEFGTGNTAHAGVDIHVTNVYGTSGLWQLDETDENDPKGNFALENFESSGGNELYEEVYFKNVGDLSTDDYLTTSQMSTGPYRLKIGGEEFDRDLNAKYVKKNGSTFPTTGGLKRSDRQKRNQTITKVTKAEAEKTASKNLLGFRPNDLAEDHHTAGFIVTRNDGARYIYGEALYNTKKEEVTFSMANTTVGDNETGLITYSPTIDNDVNSNYRGDQFFNSVSTPAYAHTYLLTCLLSTDYSDLTDDGPTDDDLGSWTLFTYSTPNTYKWRIPFDYRTANFNEGLKSDPEDDRASYVYGEKEEKYIEIIETKTHIAIFDFSPRYDGFGVDDENGGNDLFSSSEKQKLDKITLYSKEEYDLYGPANATPIKTVHFSYTYELCGGVPNNDGTDEMVDGVDINLNEGKLTLKKVWFTYRNSNMGKYAPYEFTYSSLNPDYHFKEYNVWGGYKPMTSSFTTNNTNGDNTGDPSVPEFNYVEQDRTTDMITNDDSLDLYSAAWSLTDIDLPSGGKISIDYESDDYAYVQDQKAMRMFKVVGAGTDKNPEAQIPTEFHPNDPGKAKLFNLDNSNGDPEATYLYIRLDDDDQGLDPDETNTDQDYYDRYLKTIIDDYKGLVQFRFFVNMSRDGGKTDGSDYETSGFDYINGYFEIDDDVADNYEVFADDNDVIYASIPVKLVCPDEPGPNTNCTGDEVNPISKAGWQFGRKYLSRDIYDLGGVDQNEPPHLLVNTIFQAFQNVLEIFQGPNKLLRTKRIARRFIPEKSWVRLMNPDGYKYGGGCRVSKIEMSDGWDVMTSDESSTLHGTHINESLTNRMQTYGQEYTYTTEDIDGNVISSGVATFEPLGALDNPLIQPVFVTIERVLGPDDQNYMETPFGESFFPSPVVTYGKVSVKNLERIDDNNTTDDTTDDIIVKKHATGHVVTEFYTSKDFPTLVDQTDLDIEQDGYKQADQIIQNILNINVRKHITVSQGYSIRLNDMNGKMKKQLVYAEGQDEPISGALYVYNGMNTSGSTAVELTTTTSGRLGHIVDVLRPDGVMTSKKMGVEVDVINDFRSKRTEATTHGLNVNTAAFIAGIPVIIPLILPKYNYSEDLLNMSVTTKVINTFGIQTEVIAFDNGSTVSTKNTLWDSETGEVLVTETTNEYGDKYYSMNYPSHWHYQGMRQAAINAGAELNISDNGSGVGTFEISTAAFEDAVFFEGDEILVMDYNGNGDDHIYWVDAVTSSTIQIIDENGNPFVALNGQFDIKIIRSGHRNLQATSMGSVVLQKDPKVIIEDEGIAVSGGYQIPENFLQITANTGEGLFDRKIINSGMVDMTSVWPYCTIETATINNYNGNDYLYNRLGVYRAKESAVYLTGRHHNDYELGVGGDGTTTNNEHIVDPRNDGFYTGFSPYYRYGDPDNDNIDEWYIEDDGWTSTSKVTQFSPSGFELENKDALDRFSSAQYGYNNMYPMAVGANTTYQKMGFESFEDHLLPGIDQRHFSFSWEIQNDIDATVDHTRSHTGKSSVKVSAGKSIEKIIEIE